MSLSLVRPYFKGQAEALKYKEFDGSFDSNMPGVVGTKQYHVDVGPARTTTLSMRSIGIDCDVSVDLYSATTGRDSSKIVDLAILDAEKYILAVMNVANRLSVLKNITFSSLSVEPVDPKNKNSVVSKMTFTASVVLEL